MNDVHGAIAELEDEIGRLSEQREHCRKIALAAKAAIAAGAALLVALTFRLIGGDVLWLMIAAILLLGGFVLAGSNSRTADDLAGRIAEAERQRAELIGEIELTLVPDAPRVLH